MTTITTSGVHASIEISKEEKQTSSGDVIRFSTASTTPSFVFKPIAVEPSCNNSPS